jgi:hypothetical protein
MRLRTEAAHEHGDIVATGRTSAIGVIAGSGYIVRELSFSPKETRIHKWDQEFESAFLQRTVRVSRDIPSYVERPAFPAGVRGGAGSAVGRDGRAAVIWRRRAAISPASNLPTP